MTILLHGLVAIAYLGIAAAVWRDAARRPLSGARESSPAPLPAGASWRVAIVVVWIVHAWLLRDAALVDGSWRFGFALALSATMWLVVALFWVESLVASLAIVWTVVLPLAAICALVPLFYPGSMELGRISGADGGAAGPWLPVHLAVALAAYGLLTIAAVHAVFMAALDRWLHRQRSDGWSVDDRSAADGRIERTMLGTLPPLLKMERILFRLIAVGFALLTLTVLSGVLFSEALFGKPLRLDHKTVFTLIAWATFAALLVGRATRGWRGRIALSWTLSGFAMLFLAYAGSRFVLEVVLHRV